MTREQIISELARFEKEWGEVSTLFFAEYIAKLVREDCAKVCENLSVGCGGYGYPSMPTPRDCAKSIRERSGA